MQVAFVVLHSANPFLGMNSKVSLSFLFWMKKGIVESHNILLNRG